MRKKNIDIYFYIIVLKIKTNFNIFYILIFLIKFPWKFPSKFPSKFPQNSFENSLQFPFKNLPPVLVRAPTYVERNFNKGFLPVLFFEFFFLKKKIVPNFCFWRTFFNARINSGGVEPNFNKGFLPVLFFAFFFLKKKKPFQTSVFEGLFSMPE